MKQSKKIEWFWYEESLGSPVYNLQEFTQGNKTPLKTINEGDEIATLTIIGWVSAIVKSDDTGYFGESVDQIIPLAFSEEKDCWVNYLSIHKKAVDSYRKTFSST